MGHRYCVTHESPSGLHHDLLDEGLDEGPALGQLTLVQKLAQVLTISGDGFNVVQHHPPLGHHRPGLHCRSLKPLLPFPVVLDAWLEVLDIQVSGFRQVVEPFQPLLHVGQFRLGGLQPLPLVPGDAVHLLVHQLDQLPYVGPCEHVLPNLAHHHFLELAGVEPGAIAGPAAPLHQGLADVVGELAALGVLAGHGPAAGAALDQPAEQVGTANPAGMGLSGGAGTHLLVDLAELGLGDEAGEGLLHPNRVSLVPGAATPEKGSGVGLVSENDVDAVLGPGPAGGVGDPLAVEGSGDLQDTFPRLRQVEDSLDHGSGVWVRLQRGALLGPVLDHQLAEAVGHPAGDPEAPGGGLAHSPANFFGKIFRVELVHGLDDGLHQLAGGGVVGVLGDGDHADALAPQHGLEGHGVLPLAGESGKLPDQNFAKRRLRLAGLVQHPAELGPVGDAAALGLVHVLAGDGVAVALGVVAQGPELGRHGEVHVLAVAGDPGVERRRGRSYLIIHGFCLLRLSFHDQSRYGVQGLFLQK